MFSPTRKVRHIVALSLALTSAWLLLSGHYHMLVLVSGACSLVLCLVLCLRMGIIDEESVPLHLAAKLPRYWLWLLREMVYSNISVIRQILLPNRYPVESHFGWLKCERTHPENDNAGQTSKPDLSLSDLLITIYANSITLTPGTVTVDVQQPWLLVHALHKDTLTELQAGTMLCRVCGLDSASAG